LSIKKYSQKKTHSNVSGQRNREAGMAGEMLNDEATNSAAYNYKNKSIGKQQKFYLICLLGFGIIDANVKGDCSSWTFQMD
jgi:hypothetical protein